MGCKWLRLGPNFFKTPPRPQDHFGSLPGPKNHIKQKHKNVVRYQITVSVLLITLTMLGVFFDFFDKKNLVMIFSSLFLIIGIATVMTIRSNKSFDPENHDSKLK